MDVFTIKPGFYLLSVILFITATVRGLKKGKKSGYMILSFLGVVIGLFMSVTLREFLCPLEVPAMGKPEILGQLIGTLIGTSIYSVCLLGTYVFIFMIFKFNRNDLIAEICAIVFSVTVIFGSMQLIRTLSSLEEKYSYPCISAKSAVENLFL